MNCEQRDTYGMYKIGINGSSHADGHQGPGPRLMGADTLNGYGVFDVKDEDLGDIKEFMLEMNTGRVSYAVLSFGSFLGMGDKLFAAPWNALILDAVNKRFVLNVDKARLKSAPGFDKDNWPNRADHAGAQGIHLGNAEQFKFPAIPAKAGIHALCIINDLRRAWAPAFAGVAIKSAFPLHYGTKPHANDRPM